MPERGSPTVRGRRLAAELRRLRNRRGLTAEGVARRLGWSESKISRIELHRTGVKEADLVRLMDLYQVGERRRGELLALARESAEKDWLEVRGADFPPWNSAYLQAEAEARSVWNWEPQVVPGLLQTPGYARAMMQDWQSMFRVTPGAISLRVEAREFRQRLLSRDPPLELAAVIDESVLLRRFGSSEVMREQLARLTAASALPNVDLRILRLDTDPGFAIGGFAYLQFPHVHDVPLPDMVSVENLYSVFHLESEDQTNQYRIAFEYVRDRALSPGDSLDLVNRTAREVWS